MSFLHLVKLYYEINYEWSYGYYFGLIDKDIKHNLEVFQGSNLNVRSMNRLFAATDKWLRTTCRLCRISDGRLSCIESSNFSITKIYLDYDMLLDDDDMDDDVDEADYLSHEYLYNDWDDEWNEEMIDAYERVHVEHECCHM